MNKLKSNMYLFHRQEIGDSFISALDKHLIDARNKNLKQIFTSFEGEHHRLEHVKTIRGIDFIDDSCSTCANAVWYALESMYKPTTWIMNMSQIDSISQQLLEVIEKKVEKIVIQGVYNSEVIDLFSGLGKKIFFAMNLEDAVRSAFYSCDAGDVVLFSPGSFAEEAYTPFNERGNKFKKAVSQL